MNRTMVVIPTFDEIDNIGAFFHCDPKTPNKNTQSTEWLMTVALTDNMDGPPSREPIGQ